jgi:hypothetical protein
MVARIAGSMAFSVTVLIVVSLLVGFGVLRWTGSVITSTVLGTMCGLAAAFAVNALHAAVGRGGERLSPDNFRSSSGRSDAHGGPMKSQGVDTKESQE